MSKPEFCTDQVDPSKAIRIRYVWLDAVSASLLLAGKVEGDLARSVGANPYVTKNKVYDELTDLINRFGSNLAAPGLQGSTVSTTVEGQKVLRLSFKSGFRAVPQTRGNPENLQCGGGHDSPRRGCVSEHPEHPVVPAQLFDVLSGRRDIGSIPAP